VDEYAVPTLPSRDLAETLSFYETLGFSNAGDAPHVWDYLIVRRGGIELHFYAAEAADSGGCFVWLHDADRTYEEWADVAGPEISAPEDTPYGVRSFAVIDPSGNRIQFGSGPH
jgi:catechol 2,3-dioxygenase-like lactoylglutathione lyase family enzyme